MRIKTLALGIMQRAARHTKRGTGKVTFSVCSATATRVGVFLMPDCALDTPSKAFGAFFDGLCVFPLRIPLHAIGSGLRLERVLGSGSSVRARTAVPTACPSLARPS